jgi:hypothetical protein
VPVIPDNLFVDTLIRPEMEVFDLQISAVQQLERVMKTRNFPKILS